MQSTTNSHGTGSQAGIAGRGALPPAVRAVRRRQAAEVARVLRRAAALDPSDTAVRANLCKVSVEMALFDAEVGGAGDVSGGVSGEETALGQRKVALLGPVCKECARATAADPYDFHAQFFRGSCLAELPELPGGAPRESHAAAAARAFRKAAKLNPTSHASEYLAAKMWNTAAMAPVSAAVPPAQEQPDVTLLRRARKAYRRAVKLQPNMADAWFELGLVSVELGENDHAGVALQRAAQLSSRYAQLLARMTAAKQQQAVQQAPP